MIGLTVNAVSLTDEAAHTIFETAIEAGHTYGFGYWAELKRTDEKEGRIVRIVLHEHEKASDKLAARMLDRAQLEIGLAKLLSAGVPLPEDYPDGPAAELILQYAMFGEQVYG